VARLFLSGSVPIVLTQSKAMAADPPRALSTATTQLPLTGTGVACAVCVVVVVVGWVGGAVSMGVVAAGV
jgi:hypothetical protein